jgi:flagellar assembly protein FliH
MSKLIRKAILETESRRLGGIPEPAADEAYMPASEVSRGVNREAESPRSSGKAPREEGSHEDALRRAEKLAREKGYEEGFQAGREAGEESVKSALASAMAVVSELETAREQFMENLRPQMVAAVYAATLKLIGKDLRAVAENCLYDVLRGPDRERILSIGLNEADLDQVSALPEFEAIAPYMKADPRVELGGCLVETAGGGRDCRLETQLEELTGLLTEYARQTG